MKLRILHISDLHATPPFDTLDDVWLGPAALLDTLVAKDRKFDFIVVSGDLTQAARKDEYDKLLEFSQKTLMNLLDEKKQQPQRIIFVPGNHDVDWQAQIGQPFSIAGYTDSSSDPASWAKLLDKARSSPRSSDLRMHVGKLGHLEFIKLSPEHYRKRMKNVQNFLNKFYGKSLKSSENHHFNLLNENGGEDWSAHVFPDEGIIFYGFNSCFHNDRYWTGAGINPNAIAKVQQHAALLQWQRQQKKQREFTLAAAWHHGLRGEQGRADYLEYSDLGRLYNAGFHLGFHGHTHRSESQLLDHLFSSGRFVIVSTGSLGAGSADRPDSVGNQLSIVQVYAGQIKIDVFERDGINGVYPAEPKQSHLVIRPRLDRRKAQKTQARHHERVYTVYPDGRARVDVTLKRLEARAPVLLAVLTPPYCAEAHNEKATSEHGPIPVQRQEFQDGRINYSLYTQEPVEELKWSYWVSNAFPLTPADVLLRDEPEHQWHTDLGAESVRKGFHAHPYHVRFACEELNLTIKYIGDAVEAPAPDVIDVEGVDEKERGKRVYVIAEYEHHEGGQRVWKRDWVEEQRCMAGLEATRSSITLRLVGPQMDYRYSLVYKLKPRPDVVLPDEDAHAIADELIRQCRNKSGMPPRDQQSWRKQSTSDRLTKGVETGMATVLVQVAKQRKKSFLTENSNWVGYLWDRETMRLLPCFGKFSPRSWGVRFANGAGVVGHAFRFNSPASWDKFHASHKRRSQSLIYQPKPEFHPWESDHEWVVALPLCLGLDGPPIGVLGISCTATSSFAEQLLRNRVGESYNEDGDRKGRNMKFWMKLNRVINIAFWVAVRNATTDKRWLERVEKILSELKGPRKTTGARP